MKLINNDSRHLIFCSDGGVSAATALDNETTMKLLSAYAGNILNQPPSKPDNNNPTKKSSAISSPGKTINKAPNNNNSDREGLFTVYI